MHHLFRILIGVLIVSTARAGTLTVATLDDSGAGSLRQAIADSVADDSIVFAVTGTIVLTSGELVIPHSLTISGPGAPSLAVSGNSASRVFCINDSGASVAISGLTVRNGKSANGLDGAEGEPALSPGADGGGIYSLGPLTLNQCHVIGNNAGRGGWPSWTFGDIGYDGMAGGSGGGIYCSNSLTAMASTFSGNSAGGGGAGGASLSEEYTSHGGNGAPGGSGGGICALGSVTLISCTFAGNAAGNGGGGGDAGAYSGNGAQGGSGGGLYVSGAVSVVACTFSTNAAGNGGSADAEPWGSGGNGGNGGAGGGICAAAGNTATALNSLFAQNRAGQGGAGGIHQYGTPGVAGVDGTGFDLAGDWTSEGHNLLGAVEGCTGLANGVNSDIVGSTNAPVDARLYPLGNGGDPTPTMGLPTTSPAWDAGDDALIGPPHSLTTDQRGQPRQSYSHVDIGAFETLLQGPVLAAPTVTLQSDPTNGLTLAILHTAVNPRGTATGLSTDFGVTTNYGYPIAAVSYPAGFAFVPTDISLVGLAPGMTYHFRMVATNAAGGDSCADQTFRTPAFFVNGDANGDGAVDQEELDAAYANYWQYNPAVITNLAGQGGTNVELAVDNMLGWDLTVQVSTDLVTWSTLPARAAPVYRFEDLDATNQPERWYRLRAP